LISVHKTQKPEKDQKKRIPIKLTDDSDEHDDEEDKSDDDEDSKEEKKVPAPVKEKEQKEKVVDKKLKIKESPKVEKSSMKEVTNATVQTKIETKPIKEKKTNGSKTKEKVVKKKVKEEIDSGGIRFPESLPIFAPTSSAVGSELCRKHSRLYLRQLDRLKMWALLSKLCILGT